MAAEPTQEELLLGVGCWVAVTEVDHQDVSDELDGLAKASSDPKTKSGKEKRRKSKTKMCQKHEMKKSNSSKS
ncbi:hypothetical protein PG990_009086 [Apiospora arundinis]